MKLSPQHELEYKIDRYLRKLLVYSVKDKAVSGKELEELCTFITNYDRSLVWKTGTLER